MRSQTAAFSLLDPISGVDGGTSPQSIVLGSDGNYYGTTATGGSYANTGDELGFNSGAGTIFKMTPAGVVTVLHSFDVSGDGYGPIGPLAEGSDGNFYGTTSGGGANDNGTIFSITTDGSFSTLHAFSAVNSSLANSDGAQPSAGLVSGTGNTLYGTTTIGGANGDGTIFSITTAGTFASLYSFAGSDGARPQAALISGPGGLYGTTGVGGMYSNGTVFLFASGTVTTLHSFSTLNGSAENADGAYPASSLVLGSDGVLYGAAAEGGANAKGTVFSITTGGSFNPLHSFDGTDGREPSAALVEDGDGTFYSTTKAGGANDTGTVFEVTSTGGFDSIYTFGALVNPESDNSGEKTNAGGTGPSGLLLAGGTLYGTAAGGGADGNGTVFSITTAGVLSTLFNFAESNTDGIYPSALQFGSDGNYYGIALRGGDNGTGTVFEVNPSGGLNILDGAVGGFSVVEGNDGNFYGTTGGGANGDGLVFQLTPGGVYKDLHDFTGGADGASPVSLIKNSSGQLFGATQKGGGSNNAGTIFQIATDGSVTPVYSFGGGESGYAPGSLIIGNDGNFYGVAQGGTNSQGIVFQVTPSGGFMALHTFSYPNQNGLNSDGIDPVQVILGQDGNIYGVTSEGGGQGIGTTFGVTTGGQFSLLNTFGEPSTGNYGNTPGGLVQGSDGNFYVTTILGGTTDNGAIVQVTAGGTATTLYSFGGTDDGANPEAALVEGTAGTFYGSASAGGEYGVGTFFTLIVGPVITGPLTAAGTVADPFSYQIVATNTPTSYSTGTLPAGLGLNSSTGLISGTPTAAGTFNIKLTAANAGGSSTVTLALTIAKGTPPAITSATSENGKVGTAFSYQITASNYPTSFGASGLPQGLSINGSSGLISGTPTQNGPFSVSLRASNAVGSGTATLTLTIAAEAPVITSATSESGRVGQAFSYQIAASNQPTSFGESGLPNGLSINGSTGLISGTPTKAGTSSVMLRASNAGGTGVATLNLTIVAAVPVITSSTSANGRAGQAFSYQIAATNQPTSYGASGLPSGLTLGTSGVISGTPKAAGSFSIGLRASNAGGSGTATLTLTVAEAVPVITSSTSASGTVGQAFSYQITATNGPTSYGAGGLPAGLSVNSSGLISGTPTKAGASSVSLRASNAGGSGVATLSLTVAVAGG